MTLARPRLVYLPFRAMAETTRMMLAHGDVAYDDEAIWGAEFQRRKRSGAFPWGKTPVLELDRNHWSRPAPNSPRETSEGVAPVLGAASSGARVVAQSGAIARWSARLAGCYPTDPRRAAVADSVYELGQELCTINPLVNCYTGPDFVRVRNHYFSEVIPEALPQLERELERAAAASSSSSPLLPGEAFFASRSPEECGGGVWEEWEGRATVGGRHPVEVVNDVTLADFNIFHHLDNAQLLEPDLLHGYAALQRWQERMHALPRLRRFLKERPVLNGIGEDPGLEDREGVRVTQRRPEGRAWLRDGLWCFGDDAPPIGQ
jgi:glutathione S-transferase